MTDDQIETLRLLMGHLDGAGSRHDRAIIVIGEAIKLGIDTGPEIIAALHTIGFNKRHIGIWLNSGTGSDPERHHWHRDENGVYRKHT